MKIKTTKILIPLIILLMLASCGGNSEDEERSQTVEIPATSAAIGTTRSADLDTPEVVPESTEPATPVSTLVVDSTAFGSTTPTHTPAPAATATVESSTVVYTSDGNPCIRDTIVYPTANSAGGLPPVNFDSGDAGDSSGPVLAKLPHPALSFANFVPPDGALIVTHATGFGAEHGDILVWDAAAGEEVTRFQHDNGYYAPVLNLNTPLLAAKTADGEIWLWNLDNLNHSGTVIPVRAEKTSRLALSPDGRFIAITTAERNMINDYGYSLWGVVRLFDVTTGEEVQRFEGEFLEEGFNIANGHGGSITRLLFSPDGQALLTLSHEDGTMRLWDVNSGEHLRCFEVGYRPISSASFSPDGREIATTSSDNILVWDTATSKVDRRFDYLSILEIEYGPAVFSPVGSTIISTSREERAAYIWDSETGELVGLMRHPGYVNGVGISPDGKSIVTRMRDRNDVSLAGAWIWDANHPALGRAALAQSLLIEGLNLGKQGDVEGMLVAFREAQDLSPGDGALLRPAVWDRVCRYGSLVGEGTAVLETCDTAVQLAEQEAGEASIGSAAAITVARIRDSRGLARALSGDFAGAITDFQSFVDNVWFGTFKAIELRRSWIDALRNGQNPIDEATLETLR